MEKSKNFSVIIKYGSFKINYTHNVIWRAHPIYILKLIKFSLHKFYYLKYTLYDVIFGKL